MEGRGRRIAELSEGKMMDTPRSEIISTRQRKIAELARQAPLKGYVDAVYPLSRWREAIGHANAAGRLGTVKVVFDPVRE